MATTHGATSLDLLIGSEEAGRVASRANLFDPTPTVWSVTDALLEQAVPTSPAAIEATPIEPEIAELLAMPEVVIAIEHGVVTGECRGLEVARVTGLGKQQRLDVGVGAYDQGAFAVMNPALTSQESLAEVVAQVLEQRRRGARPHPLNRLVRERWLRSELVESPSRIGMRALDPVEGIDRREGLHDSAPAFAVAWHERTLVACSVGIDLDLVPAAAEVSNRHGLDRIVLVLPDRDQHRMTRTLASRCRMPVTIETADTPWPAS